MTERVVVMPPMGDAPGDLVLTNWLKQPGDAVAKGEPLFEVATDKVNVSVEALVSGTVSRLLLAEGLAAAEGEPIAYIEDGLG
jgi:pyruvate/2-oxoglutarate dehydrogenase complex dihydrolipoamide acyltransferase (E2) component